MEVTYAEASAESNDVDRRRGIMLNLSTKRKVANLVLAFVVAFFGFVQQPEAHANGPCKVTGYTIHAQLQMSSRDISRAEVLASVRMNCHRGKWHPNQRTWLYGGHRGLPDVVMNKDGVVVTAFYRSRPGFPRR